MSRFVHGVVFVLLSLILGVAAPVAGAGEPIDDVGVRKALVDAVVPVIEAGAATSVADMLAAPVAMPEGVALAKPGRRVLSGPEVYRHLADSALVLGLAYKCDECENIHIRTVSAFAIGTDGLVATNRHVLRDTDLAAVVMDAEGRIAPVRGVVTTDEEADLALLLIEGLDLPAIPLAPMAPSPGEPIWVLSHPARHYFLFTQGIVSRIAVDPTHGGPTINITADYARGSSGGPIVDSRGNLVSVVKSTRSLHANHDDAGHAEDLQMVVHHTIPAERVRGLIESVMPE